MKEKVAKAIEERGEAVVRAAASELRRAVEAFGQKCKGPMINLRCLRNQSQETRKVTAQMLRALADQIEKDATQEPVPFQIPTVYWDNAKEQARKDFFAQFDQLTRFVNKDVPEEGDPTDTTPDEDPRDADD